MTITIEEKLADLEARMIEIEKVLGFVELHNQLSLRDCINRVSEFTRFSVEDLRNSKTKVSTDLTDARFLFFKYAKLYNGSTHKIIGRYCNRDHSLVTHGIKKASEEPVLKRQFAKLLTTNFDKDEHERLSGESA